MLSTISPQGLSESAVAAKLVLAEQRFKEPSRSDGTCEARRIYHINCVVGFCPPNAWRLSLLHQTTQAAHTQALMERLVSSLLDKLECLMSRRLYKLFKNEDNVGRSVAQTWGLSPVMHIHPRNSETTPVSGLHCVFLICLDRENQGYHDRHQTLLCGEMRGQNNAHRCSRLGAYSIS